MFGALLVTSKIADISFGLAFSPSVCWCFGHWDSGFHIHIFCKSDILVRCTKPFPQAHGSPQEKQIALSARLMLRAFGVSHVNIGYMKFPFVSIWLNRHACAQCEDSGKWMADANQFSGCCCSLKYLFETHMKRRWSKFNIEMLHRPSEEAFSKNHCFQTFHQCACRYRCQLINCDSFKIIWYASVFICS